MDAHPPWLQFLIDRVNDEDIQAMEARLDSMKPDALHEEVVGKVPDHLKKLFVVWVALMGAATLTQQTAEEQEAPCPEIIKALKEKSKIAHGLFFGSLREILQLHEKNPIDVRAGWDVVIWRLHRSK